MEKLNAPITKENFPANWQIVASTFRKTKKKYYISKISSFFGNMMFTLLALLSVNGLLYNLSNSQFPSYLEDIPYLVPIWKQWSSLFISSGQDARTQLLVTAGVVYGCSFVVHAVSALFVTLIYRPALVGLPTGTPKENATRMLAMAKDARHYSKRTRISKTAFWSFLFILCQFILLSLYCVIEIGSADKLLELCTSTIMKGLAPLITSQMTYITIQTALFVPSLIIFVLLLFLAFSFAAQLLSMVLRITYYCNVPYSFVVDVEHYYVFADAENDEDIEKAKEALVAQADSICQQAVELELWGAYKKSKDLFAQAAHCGHVEAMEHYARHWLVTNSKDPARYWLQKCVDTGNASSTAVKNLRRLKLRKKIQAKYLKPNKE